MEFSVIILSALFFIILPFSSLITVDAMSVTFNNGSKLTLDNGFFKNTFLRMNQTGIPGTFGWELSLVTPSFSNLCTTPVYLGQGSECEQVTFKMGGTASPNNDESGVTIVFTTVDGLQRTWTAAVNVICDPSRDKLYSPSNSYAASMNGLESIATNFTFSSKGACLRCRDALDAATCSNYGSKCTWCAEWNLCTTSTPAVNPSRPLLDPSPLGVCQCGTYSKDQCESMSSVCQWNSKILVGVEYAYEYCSANLQCDSPTTCEGLNLAPIGQLQQSCEAAGCTYSFFTTGICASGTCFNFFLPSFVSQPFVLLFVGFAKDVVVLLLIGAIGDRLARRIQRLTICIKVWWKNWSEEQMEIRLLDTVYLIDDECYDGYAMNFEQYCDRVCDQLFELNVDDDEKKNDVAAHKQAVRDAVSFGLFDSGLWIDLDEKEEEQRNNNNEQLSGDFTPRDGEPNEQQNLIAHDKQSSDNFERVTLESAVFASRIKLQEIVTKTIEERASAIVFYAHSRECKARMASSLNSFPSDLQLLMYCFGVASMFAFAMYTVVFKNKHIVERIASASCDQGSFNSTADGSSSLFLNSTSDFDDNVALAEATYFLLGFRLMNASTFGTAMLVFVKVVRAIYQRVSGKLSSLTISQRLPLISLYSNRTIQLLLLFYATLVFPFCWTGLVYGWHLAVECLIPPAIGLATLILDAAVLKAVRTYFRTKTEGENNISTPTPSTTSLLEVGQTTQNDDTNENDQQHSSRSFTHHEDNDDENDNQLTNSIQSAAPQTFWRALLVFLLSEEIPTIIITIALQTSFNYVSLLNYQDAFGIDAHNVVRKDFDSREVECIWQMFEKDVSGAISALTSVVAFW